MIINLLCELENFIILSINKTRLLIWNSKQQMFTINNKQQPPKASYKKAVLKNFSIFTGKYLCSVLFLIKLRTFRSATLLKRDSNTSVFLWILRNFLKKVSLKKICERLLLKNVKGWMLSVSQHLQEIIFTGLSFLINIVAACNLSLSLFKKRFQHWCFPDSYLNFLTATF